MFIFLTDTLYTRHNDMNACKETKKGGKVSSNTPPKKLMPFNFCNENQQKHIASAVSNWHDMNFQKQGCVKKIQVISSLVQKKWKNCLVWHCPRQRR